MLKPLLEDGNTLWFVLPPPKPDDFGSLFGHMALRFRPGPAGASLARIEVLKIRDCPSKLDLLADPRTERTFEPITLAPTPSSLSLTLETRVTAFDSSAHEGSSASLALPPQPTQVRLAIQLNLSFAPDALEGQVQGQLRISATRGEPITRALPEGTTAYLTESPSSRTTTTGKTLTRFLLLRFVRGASTGSSRLSQLSAASAVWTGQAGIELRPASPPEVIVADTAIDGPDALSIMQSHDSAGPETLVFFTDANLGYLATSPALGGGGEHRFYNAQDRVVVSDAASLAFPCLLAHELGHVLGGDHPGSKCAWCWIDAGPTVMSVGSAMTCTLGLNALQYAADQAWLEVI